MHKKYKVVLNSDSWKHTIYVHALSKDWAMHKVLEAKLAPKESIISVEPSYIRWRLPVVMELLSQEYLAWYISGWRYVFTSEIFLKKSAAENYAEWSASSDEA